MGLPARILLTASTVARIRFVTYSVTASRLSPSGRTWSSPSRNFSNSSGVPWGTTKGSTLASGWALPAAGFSAAGFPAAGFAAGALDSSAAADQAAAAAKIPQTRAIPLQPRRNQASMGRTFPDMFGPKGQSPHQPTMLPVGVPLRESRDSPHQRLQTAHTQTTMTQVGANVEPGARGDGPRADVAGSWGRAGPPAGGITAGQTVAQILARLK